MAALTQSVIFNPISKSVLKIIPNQKSSIIMIMTVYLVKNKYYKIIKKSCYTTYFRPK